MESVGSGLRTLGAIAAGAALAGITAVGIAGFKAASSFEMMQLSLQSLSARETMNAGQAENMAEAFDKSAGKAAELYSWVRQLAIASPFSAEGVANAFRTAEAYGFTAEMAKRLTQATIDFASATGQSEAAMNSIALALGQIQAKGKLSAQEVLQLTNVGVPALQYLANAFGKTTGEISKMMERGLIPADKAVEAITKGMETDFAGAAKRTQNTLQGLTSTLGDLWQMSTAALVGGIFKGFAPLAAQVSSWLQSEGIPLFEQLGTKAGESASQITAALSGTFANIRAGMPVMDALQRLLPNVFTPEVKTAIESIGDSLGKIGTALSPAVSGLIQGFGDALRTAFGDGRSSLIIDNITTAFQGLATFFTNNGPTIAAAATLIGQVLGATLGGVITLVSGLAAALGQLAAGDFAGALTTLGNTLTAFANGVTQAFAGVDFSSVAATWASNLNMIGTIIGASVGNAMAAAQLWANEVVGGLLGPIAQVPGNIVGYISGAISALQGLVGQMSAAGAALGQGLVSGAAGVVGKIVGVVVGAVEAAIAAAKAAAGISSPSKETMYIGSMMGQGLAQGLTQSASLASAAMNMTVNQTLAPAYAAPLPSTPAGTGGGGAGNNVVIYASITGVGGWGEALDGLEREAQARGIKLGMAAS